MVPVHFGMIFCLHQCFFQVSEMTSVTEEGESVCGPICQHPSCWEAEKRRSRGLPPLPRVRTPPKLTLDDGN